MANITGTDGDNILTGTVNDDVINGLAGNDTIDAGDGNDIIIGGLGADKMSGGIGNDEFLVGGTEIVAGETIDGGTGNNKISTWGGDLSLATITNVQTLGLHLNSLKLSATQMAGFTSLTAYNNAPVTLTAANAGTYSLANKTVTGTFNLTGSSGNDKLVGNAAAQTLDGGDGNDTIVGGLGADTMLGGAGDDEFLAGGTEIAAGEIIDGGTGYNTLSTWGGDLSLATITNVQKLGVHLNNIRLTANQLAGFWDIQAYDGPVTITAAGAGIYILPYRSAIGVFNFVGSSGIDSIFGTTLTQSIDGGDGNDYLATANLIHGGNGDDTVAAQGYSGSTLYGDNGNDSIYGYTGADVLYGGNDDDVLRGDQGADTLTGGGGADRFVYSTTADSTATQSDVLVDFVEGTDKIDVTGLGFGGLSTGVVKAGQLKVSYDAALNRTTIADLFGSNFSLILNGNHLNIGYNDFIGLQNVINGTNGNDHLVGTAQRDILSGLDGNDVLQGGLGADTMLGGAGDDEFLAGGTEIVAGEFIDGGSGFNTLSTWGGDLSLATISNVQTLGVHLDHITLSADQLNSFRQIVGYDGPFTIYGSGAGQFRLTDQMDQFADNDYTFIGTQGNDDIGGRYSRLGNRALIQGMDGDDTISLSGYYGILSGGFSVDGGIGIDTLIVDSYDPNEDPVLSKIDVRNIEIIGGHMVLNGAQIHQYALISEGYFTAASEGAYDFSTTRMQGASGVHFLSFGNSTITGTNLDDTLVSKGVNSVLHGGSGNDFINILQGGNEIYGDAGDDYFSVEENAISSRIDGGAGFNTVYGRGNSYAFVNLTEFTLDNVQELAGYVTVTHSQLQDIRYIKEWSGISVSEAGTYDLRSKITTGSGYSFFGSAGDDFIIGSDGVDYIVAGGGNDTVNANGGNDLILCDDSGVDRLNGGDGDDTFYFNTIRNAYNQIIDGGAGYNRILMPAHEEATIVLANMQLSNIQEIAGRLIIKSSDLLKYKFSDSTRLIASTDGLYDLSPINDGTIYFYGSAGDDKIVYGSNTRVQLSAGAGNDEVHANDLGNFIDGGSGLNTIYGGAGDDVISGGTDKDIIYGYGGNDTLYSHGGYDDIHGGTGSDTYYGRAMTLYEEDDNATGSVDVLQLDNQAYHDQLWFRQIGGDLVIDTIGTTDRITVKDWYLGSAHHVEEIRSTNGRTLLDTQVQNLVNAMAGFAVPSTMTLSAAYHAALDPVLAANWT